VLAEEPYKVVTKQNHDPFSVEKYHVLRSNKKIKEGKYQKFTFNNSLLECGYYKENLKDSLWIQYLRDKIVCEGLYKNGIKIGEWSYYSGENLIYRYDYQNDSLLFFDNIYCKQKGIIVPRIRKKDEWMTEKVDRPPLLLNSELGYFIAFNVNYPKEAQENDIQGTVLTLVTVSKTGKTLEYSIIKSVNEYLDRAALDVVRKTSDWCPAIYNGEKVDSQIIIPVSFILM
jgi:TonB family protein